METSRKTGDVTGILNRFENTRHCIRGFAMMLSLALDGDDGGAMKRDSLGIAGLLEQQEQDLEEVEDALREEFATLKEQRFQDQHVRKLLTSVGIDNDEPDVIRKHLMGYFRQEGEDRIAEIARYLEMARETVALVLSCAIHPKTYREEQFLAGWDHLKAEARENFRRAILTHLGSEEIHRVARKFNLDDDTVYSVIVDIAVPTDDDAQPQPSSEMLAERLKGGVDAAEIAQALNLKKATVERVIAQLVATPAHDVPDQQAANG